MPQTFTKIGLPDTVTSINGGWLRGLQNYEFLGVYHYTDYSPHVVPGVNDYLNLGWYKGKLAQNAQYYDVNFYEVPDVTVVRDEDGVEAYYLFTKLKWHLNGVPAYGGQWNVRPLPLPSWYDQAVGALWFHNVVGYIGPCPKLRESVDQYGQQLPAMLWELKQIEPCESSFQTPDPPPPPVTTNSFMCGSISPPPDGGMT